MKVKKTDISDRMREFAVEADSAEDFIRRYHARNEMYLENFDILVDGSKKDVEKWGYDILPAHISVTGELVSFFPKNRTEGNEPAKPFVFGKGRQGGGLNRDASGGEDRNRLAAGKDRQVLMKQEDTERSSRKGAKGER